MRQDIHFPRLVAETLAGTPLVLPDSIDSGLAIVVLVFRRNAQPIVDSWLTPVARRYADTPGISWYEIPMLAGGWRMVSGFIDGGMRAGIPPAYHAHVATYYGDTTRFQSALGMDDPDSAYLYLIDADGNVLWTADGWAHPRRMEELHERVETALAQSLDE